MRTDCPVHKQQLPCQPCAETDAARAELGLPHDRFADVGGGIGPGCRIAVRCIHCGKLFVSRSHNLADVESVRQGDCGCTKPAA